MVKQTRCEFYEVYGGRCDEEADIAQGLPSVCEEHLEEKCSNCGEQAIGQCPATVTSFVCGRPLCPDCTCPKHNETPQGIDTTPEDDSLNDQDDLIARAVDDSKDVEDRVAVGIVNNQRVKLSFAKKYTAKNQTIWYLCVETENNEKEKRDSFQNKHNARHTFDELVDKYNLTEI
jgi:hypothetical protein